jgi:hypothetical protein
LSPYYKLRFEIKDQYWMIMIKTTQWYPESGKIRAQRLGPMRAGLKVRWLCQAVLVAFASFVLHQSLKYQTTAGSIA